jgi:aryl-alcohol dehydrogenase-like predicted oxidoreductase
LQSEYSLSIRQHEKVIISTIEELEIGLIACLQPFRQRISYRKDDENTKFHQGDFKNTLPRFTEEVRKANASL